MDHHLHRKQTVSPEVAMASDVFDQFCNATTLKSILGHFRHLCDLLKIKPTNFPQFYPKLKSKLRSWKAQALWKKFDQRANHKCYNRGKACPNTRVLIIGGGPCGMRSAIEAQLLGAKVVVVEKRDRMSRNNVLHLWPFVIQDLRGLGAKKFFGKFCAGSIDHISIRQLQCILLKVGLILGVEFHESVSFESLVPPPENQEGGKIGWRAKTTPSDHPVSQYEFDVLIGADGKRNTLDGFKRKEFRGKLAIAITANFINKRTEAEARVEEISGVAFIFNQKFFKELYSDTGIDLENIVYYKDDTHYFVMTAKKHSLIDKGVILQDHADTAKLLAKENVNREALMEYAREAAEFSTEYQMMDMEFAVNHYGQPDVAMFDFTSMYAAENASRVVERRGHRLLMILVGDSLLEPFWPTGSGCARGFLSSLDAGWAIKGWGGMLTPLEVIAERESIYRLLGQTTPENLNRDYAAYTIDPHTRYPNLNVRCVTHIQVRSLLESDDPETFKLSPVQTTVDLPKKRRRRDSQVHPDTLLHWLQRQVALYDGVRIHDMGLSFKSGLALAAIINRYRPDLLDFHALKKDDSVTTNQIVFDVLEKEFGIPPIMTGEEMLRCEGPDKLAMFSYLTQIYEAFRGEIPHIKHPKLEPETDDGPTFNKKINELTSGQKAQLLGRIAKSEGSRSARRSRHSNENLPLGGDKKSEPISRRHARKRRSNEKMGATVEERMQRLMDIEKNRLERMLKRQQQRKRQTEQFYKSLQMLQANAKRDKEEPFEDYSIFLYRQTAPDFKDRVKDLEQKILYPDREPKLHAGHNRGNVDEDFCGRIKNIEEKLKGSLPTDKKPKDLLRAIGKIEKTDWNVKEIEKKIEENKMGKSTRHDKVERVPKWSREQFLARQTKMEKKGRDPCEVDSKYADIDGALKNIDRKIKGDNVLGHNKVSAMAEQFANKNQDSVSGSTENKVQRSNSKAAIALPAQGGSETCHFCEKRVYLMERLTAEGKSFHRGCFRCEYCSTSLRIGNHTFDREKNGGRFYCTQHFGLPGTMKSRSERRKLALTNKENIPHSSNAHKAPSDKSKTSLGSISGLDLLDRGQTPERIEFENLAGVSDNEEAHSIMDEDEWTDRNFGQSAAEMGSSDDISDLSDSDDDNEAFEEAMDQPLTTEGTLELAKNWTLRYSHPTAGNSDTGSNEYEDSSDEYTDSEEDSQTATDDEEDARARELRKQEVYLPLPMRNSDTETGSDTEVKLASLSNNNNSSNNNNTNVNSSEQLYRVNTNDPALSDSRPDDDEDDASSRYSDSSCRSQKSQRRVRKSRSFGSNLPDLIANSSPRLSRNSSRSSMQSFGSTGNSSVKSRKKSLKVKLLAPGDNNTRPSVTVTAPTPTAERPSSSRSSGSLVESDMLTVPREKSPIREVEAQENPTSFDNLILELRQRKAKNKAESAKETLKPLAADMAKVHVQKFFVASSPSPSARSGSDSEDNKLDSADEREGIKMEESASSETEKEENYPPCETKREDLPLRSKVSDKIDKKDMLKYFSGSSFDKSPSLTVTSATPEKKQEVTQVADNIVPVKLLFNDDDDDMDAEILGEIDRENIDDIEREFEALEEQNKISSAIDLSKSLEDLKDIGINEPLTEIDVMNLNEYIDSLYDPDNKQKLYATTKIDDANVKNENVARRKRKEESPPKSVKERANLFEIVQHEKLMKAFDVGAAKIQVEYEPKAGNTVFDKISQFEVKTSDDSCNSSPKNDSPKPLVRRKSTSAAIRPTITISPSPAANRYCQKTKEADREIKPVARHHSLSIPRKSEPTSRKTNQSPPERRKDGKADGKKPTVIKSPSAVFNFNVSNKISKFEEKFGPSIIARRSLSPCVKLPCDSAAEKNRLPNQNSSRLTHSKSQSSVPTRRAESLRAPQSNQSWTTASDIPQNSTSSRSKQPPERSTFELRHRPSLSQPSPRKSENPYDSGKIRVNLNRSGELASTDSSPQLQNQSTPRDNQSQSSLQNCASRITEQQQKLRKHSQSKPQFKNAEPSTAWQKSTINNNENSNAPSATSLSKSPLERITAGKHTLHPVKIAQISPITRVAQLERPSSSSSFSRRRRSSAEDVSCKPAQQPPSPAMARARSLRKALSLKFNKKKEGSESPQSAPVKNAAQSSDRNDSLRNKDKNEKCVVS